MIRDHLTIKLYDSLGCTVVATAMIQCIQQTFPNTKLHVYSAFPDLLTGFTEADHVADSRNEKLHHYDVNIGRYLETRKPQESLPYRHLLEHMLEEAEIQLHKHLSRGFYPVLHLTDEEEEKAMAIVHSLREQKPMVWL